MGLRIGRVLPATIVCVAILAMPASAAHLRILAHWKVTIAGTVTHKWSLPDVEPCQATGDGSLTAHFESVRPQRITIANNGFGPGDISWNGVFHIHGKITAVDGRTRNPPDPGQDCSTSAPVPDTRACGTRQFHTGLLVEMPLRTVRRTFDLTDSGSFTTPALNAPGGVEDCERDGFDSFADIGVAARPGSEDLPMPGYPSAARLGSARVHRIVVAVSQRRRFVPSAQTFRQVKIVFTRGR